MRSEGGWAPREGTQMTEVDVLFGLVAVAVMVVGSMINVIAAEHGF